MLTESGLKAVATKTGANVVSVGIIASISQSPDFWMLTITALIVSTFSWNYDIKTAKEDISIALAASLWTKYVISGWALMLLSFYGLMTYVPPQHQLPITAWYALSTLPAGFSVNIISWAGGFLPSIADKLRDKWVK